MEKTIKIDLIAFIIVIIIVLIHFFIISISSTLVSATGNIILSDSTEYDRISTQSFKSSIEGGSSNQLPQPIHKSGILFDVDLIMPEKYKEIFTGEELVMEVDIINLRRIGLVDVIIEHSIENLNGEIITKKIETKGVENKISYLKTIKIPNDLFPGDYMAYARINYKEDETLAGAPFRVVESKEEKLMFYHRILDYSIILIIFLFILFILYENKRYKRIENLIKEVKIKDLKRTGLVRR